MSEGEVKERKWREEGNEVAFLGVHESGRVVKQVLVVWVHLLVFYPCSSCHEDSVSRKVMVLDLDETLIHSHHDGYVTIGSHMQFTHHTHTSHTSTQTHTNTTRLRH